MMLGRASATSFTESADALMSFRISALGKVQQRLGGAAAGPSPLNRDDAVVPILSLNLAG